MLIVLHLLIDGPLAPLLPGKTTACRSIVRSAWAEEAPAGMPATPRAENQEAPAPGPEVRTSSTGSAPADAASTPEDQAAEPGFVDMLHGGISQGLLTTADWLDSFFADERSVKEENRSYIRASYDVFHEDRSPAVYKPSFDVRLVLPQLQKKTHLVFSAEPAEAVSGSPAPVSTAGTRVAPTEERNVTTAFQYFFRETVQESFTIRTGARFHSGSPVLFIAPRYRSLIPLQIWNFRFSQEAVYRTDTKWQADTTFDLERKLPHDLFFRTSLAGVWFENTKGYFYSLSGTLRQPLDATHAFQYEWVNSYQTRPVNELAEIALRVRYRQSFWRKWLFFELAPQVRFPRDRNFDATPGVLFRFEMFFGKKDL
jgi:hypothetical protein